MSQSPEFRDGREVSFGDGEDEPTSIIKMIEDLKSSRRQSLLTARRRESGSVSSAASLYGANTGRKINFDRSDKMFESSSKSMKRWSSASSASKAKIPRLAPTLGPDPLQDLSVLKEVNKGPTGLAMSQEVERLKLEVSRLAMKLVEKESEVIECKAQVAKWEGHVKTLEMNRKRDNLRLEQDKDKLEIERKRFHDQVEDLQHQIEVLKRQKQHKLDEQSLDRRQSLQKRYDIEAEVAKLEKLNENLSVELQELRSVKEEMEKTMASERLTRQREIESLESHLEEVKEKLKLEHHRAKRASELQEAVGLKEADLSSAKRRIESLENELKKNEDAVVQRNVMKKELEDYPRLRKENDSLRMENQLLSDTMDNTSLLKEKVNNLSDSLHRAEELAQAGREAQAELEQVRQQLGNWESLCQRLASGTSPQLLQTKVAELQKIALEAQDDLNGQRSKLEEEQRRTSELTILKQTLESQLKTVSEANDEQNKLVKRLQRKLLLISKERDSLKGVLDSYEKELTFTGGQFDKDKIEAMEKVVQAHKETIEKLEDELAQTKNGGGSSSVHLTEAKVKIEELKTALMTMQESRDALEEQLESVQGNKADETRVLHFTQNPASIMIKSREVDFKKLQQENDSLKARVRLLEEGQTRDLTLLVGQKMEEEPSSQEVKALRELLSQSEVKRERILDAFRKTSQDFREVCCQLTGYRIDGLANNQYRLSPVYAESDSDSLLFARDASGECMLLETPFSSQLTELIDIHLNRQHSIPVFLAAVITDLFSRQTFENTISTTDVGGGGEDDDPICID